MTKRHIHLAAAAISFFAAGVVVGVGGSSLLAMANLALGGALVGTESGRQPGADDSEDWRRVEPPTRHGDDSANVIAPNAPRGLYIDVAANAKEAWLLDYWVTGELPEGVADVFKVVVG